MKELARGFFGRDTAQVAQDLLGKVLVRDFGTDLVKGRIVETEAYYGKSDPPSHASFGRTGRSKIMWKKPGLAYVYLIYGIHLMLNVVTESPGTPGAVLFRAVEPLEGVEAMKTNRNGADVKELTDGPGKLTQAFGIGKEMNGEDLVRSNELRLVNGETSKEFEIATSGRIGVSQGKEEQLRFYLANNDFTSR